MIPTYAALLVAILTGAQERPAAPVVPFQQIVACVRAGACRNMTPARIHWFDVINIDVLTFADGGWTYGLNVAPARNRPERLTVFLTPPGESRPTQQLGLDINGKLVTAELGPQPGEMVPGRVDYATWVLAHQAYSAAEWHPSGQVSGEQFKPFWQKQADQALAAATRATAAQDNPGVPFAQILACVSSANCKNMTPARMSAWSDVGPGMGMVFDDNGWKYELSLSGPVALPRDLAVMTTGPGETRPGQLITFDSNGKLVSASLARPPGEPAAVASVNRTEPLEESWKRRKSFVAEPRWSRGGTLGEEFRPFWQKQADQALAAIARTLTRDPQAQEKPAISFDQIVACVKAGDCPNMKKSSVGWYDQVGIPVLEFTMDDQRFALASRREGLSFWVALKGESQPSRLITVGADGKVISAELAAATPGRLAPHLLTPAQSATWRQDMRAFSSVRGTGEEFKTFWQEQADSALAAIRRQLSK